MQEQVAARRPEMNQWLKLALDLGPLLLFFFINARFGIFAATATFMGTTLISLAVTYALVRRIPTMPLITAGIVMVFGGLTLFLQDETFIKLKPTIIYALFAAVLFAGLFTGRPLLALVMDSVFHLRDEGWRKLTLRWAIFFLVMAVLNEFVWRNYSTDAWVAFKTFGFLPLTIVFALAQTPLLMRYAAQEKS